MTKADG